MKNGYTISDITPTEEALKILNEGDLQERLDKATRLALRAHSEAMCALLESSGIRFQRWSDSILEGVKKTAEEATAERRLRDQDAEIVSGGGSLGTPRQMTSMFSFRLSGAKIRQLRNIANADNLTLSEFMRQEVDRILEEKT